MSTPTKTSKQLFSNTPKPVQELAELARQEQREKARREFKKNQQQKNWDRTVGPF